MTNRKSKDVAERATKTGFAVYDSRPWLKFYPPGAKHELGKLRHTSFGAMINQASAEHAHKPAFSSCLPNGMTGTLTYTQINTLSDQFAAYLRYELGLKKGERVAIQTPNCLAYPIVAFGIAKAGCVLVNVNPLYTGSEMVHQLQDSGAKVLVIIDMFTGKLAEVMPKVAVKTVITVNVAEFFPAVRKFIVKTVQQLRKEIPKPPVASITFSKSLKLGSQQLQQGHSLAKIKVDLDDLLALQYTGGTTGVSKGAMLSHRNVLSNLDQARNFMDLAMPEKRVALTALPMYHIFALGLAGIIYDIGGHNVLIPSPRPVSNLRSAFEKFDITIFAGVNTLYNGLLNEPWFSTNPPRNLTISIAGGTALQKAVAERWHKIVGYEIFQAYGLTETSPGVTANPLGGFNKLGTIGIPNIGTFVRLVDDDGKPAPLGEPGELIVKGPQVTPGYWKRPEETAKSIRAGWFYTGDIAVMDKDGYFTIVDRKKDMILVSGFNVYPNEIEDCIAKHADVLEVGVIGVPDKQSDEVPRAYVVRRDTKLTAEEVIAHCRKWLTNYKVPKQVVFCTELPKSPVGKVLRKDLRSQAMKEFKDFKQFFPVKKEVAAAEV